MAAALPLLTWKEDAEIGRLFSERKALMERMAGLPRHSHLRIELTGRLKALTALQLRLETEAMHKA